MNLPSNINSLVNALETSLTQQAVTSGDTPFLRLLKSGEWVFGGDDCDVPASSKWAVNTASFGMGFQAWDNGELAGEEVAPFTAPPILKSDLENVGAEWKPMITVHLACISGTYKGTVVMYKTTAKGGIKAMKELMQSIVDHFKAHPDSDKFIPVVTLNTDSYKHKTYGKIYTPVISIVDWLADTPEAAAVVMADPEPTTAEPEEPVRRRRRS